MAHVRFLAWRLVQSVPVLIGVTLIVFLMIHLVPGDPARTALGLEATPRAIAQLRHAWGLDRSLVAQYLLFMKRLFTGNLGTSLRYGVSAGALVRQRLPVTLWLIVYSAVLTWIFAVPLALWAASRPGAVRDGLVRVVCVAGLSVPGFWLGLVLIEFVAVKSNLLPGGGFGQGIAGHVESLFLPSLTIAVGIVPLVVRSLRAEVLKVADSDYTTTARAKGLSERQILLRHVFRNALGPAVTVLAVNISFLIGGTVVVENVFSLGGVGSLMLQAINNRDFPVVQAVTLILAFVVVVVNILGDLAQAALDPRFEAA